MYLTNVPTFENSALILFLSVFGREPRSHVWLGCDERFTWVDSFDENTGFAETPGSMVSPLFGQQRQNLVNMREHLNGSEHLCIFFFFLKKNFARLNQRLERYTEGLACPYANVDAHQSRSVGKFYVAQFLRCCLSFSSFLSREGILYCCGQLRTCLADR